MFDGKGSNDIVDFFDSGWCFMSDFEDLNRAASLTNPQRLAIQLWATGPHSGSMEVPTAAMIRIGEFDIIGRLNGLDWVLSALHCGFDPYGPP